MDWDELPFRAMGKFRQSVVYCPDSDSATLFVSDDECFRERVDRLLTLYRSIKTRNIVGCHIKFVSESLR